MNKQCLERCGVAVAEKWYEEFDQSYIVVRETVPTMKTNMGYCISIHGLSLHETGNLGLLSVRNFMLNDTPKILKLEFYSQTKRYDVPGERGKTSLAARNRYDKPEERQKTSLASIKRYDKPEEREKTSLAATKRYDKPEERLKSSLAATQRFREPQQRKKLSIAAILSPFVKCVRDDNDVHKKCQN